MAKYNKGDKVFFFVNSPSDKECYCGEGVITSVEEDTDTENVFIYIGSDCYSEDEIFSSWKDIAESACKKLKVSYLLM